MIKAWNMPWQFNFLGFFIDLSIVCLKGSLYFMKKADIIEEFSSQVSPTPGL